MTEWFRARQLVPVVGSLLLLAACANRTSSGWTEITPPPASAAPLLQTTGTVQHLDIEGGVFVIVDPQGTRFNPTNLPQDFRVAGLAVEFAAVRRTDVVSIVMVGPIVDLVRIRRQSASSRP